MTKLCEFYVCILSGKGFRNMLEFYLFLYFKMNILKVHLVEFMAEIS